VQAEFSTGMRHFVAPNGSLGPDVSPLGLAVDFGIQAITALGSLGSCLVRLYSNLWEKTTLEM
jgi:hypothetical protein